MPMWRRTQLAPGVYDEPLTERLHQQLEALNSRLAAHRTAGAVGVLPLQSWVSEAVDLALSALAGEEEKCSALAQEVVALLARHAPMAFSRPSELALRSGQLRAITEPPAAEPRRPKGSLHAASLLANAPGERLLEHLCSEFDSADRIDLLCAFIKLSGIEKLRAELERHCSGRGRKLRVLTTTYMGASDARAIERLAALPNVEIRISYDDSATRLHAKAWIFHRDSGYSTAYIGSSNLSHAAQTDGLEWNVRLTEQGQPALLAQMAETFEQYWSDPWQFEAYHRDNETHRRRLSRALSPERMLPGPLPVGFDLEPKDFQRPILDELAQARRAGRHRNLLLAATGTGKTVMAALDYRRLREADEVDTLLFVAHRREILEQSRQVFRVALNQPGFGELLVDGLRPAIGRHVFASVQSLGEDAGIDPARFDMLIIDEAHHSPAASWERLLLRAKPKELLGLTGTPERADGLDHEQHFPRPWVGNLRVWNAIPQALVPFRYYMLDVSGVSLRDVHWQAGRYDSAELSGRLVGASEIFVRMAVQALAERVARPEKLRAIAFCVDVRHAEEVDRRLRAHGWRSQVLTGSTPTAERLQARTALDSGEVQVLCVIDIYNEGVDVPNVNTLFFFRPTESATVFLQQLGRGLRRAPDKAELVVFDLSGRQHHEFRFDRKLRALLGHTPRELRELMSKNHGRLPTGCLLHFDEVCRNEVLAQIERSIPTTRRGILELMREPAHAHLSLPEFLHETDVELDDIYRKDWCWTLMRAAAGLDRRTIDERERAALERVHKLIHVGDSRRLDVWEQWACLDATSVESRWEKLDEAERRTIWMMFGLLYAKEHGATAVAREWWAMHSVLREEVRGLIPVLRRLNAILPIAHSLAPEIPLVPHARYLGVELSAAFEQLTSQGHLRDFYTGVESVAGGRFDLLLVTMEKPASTKEHLRYRDFPLSEDLFHWQSKARTAIDSAQGRRHLDPVGQGVRPLLFVREQADRASGQTMAFQYLGPVTPAAHAGERPITIEWRLEFPMPLALVQSGRIAA